MTKDNNELATKGFVRAEITKAKQELKLEMTELKIGMFKWIAGIILSISLIVSIGINFALFSYLVQNLRG
ncbi:hypothetical protein [uncultured Helicobacter sp.]|uniref:hypothetical protein n=1 Tax=uncultured Helicobacter sp. TaxID=175537 RepID=UPI00374F90A4